MYTEKTGVELMIYGLDFYYATGTWFPSEMKRQNRTNIIAIVRKAWEKYRAIPCFSWHLENPYTPSGYKEYMGCRYRYGIKGYPVEHQYVIKEILEGKGSPCGIGSYTGKDNEKFYVNPSVWFDEQCKELAEIIKEFVDENNKLIPIILRLWHEFDGNWQWWGKNSVTADDYKDFFRMTKDKIEEYSHTRNILYAYCPDRLWNTEKEFLSHYPGDKYVDLIGFDDYSIGTTSKALENTIARARIVSSLAKRKQKVAALFETANDKEQSSETFFNEFITPILKAKGVNMGIVQIWSTCKIDTEEEINDRISFLKSGIVTIVNNK